MHALMLTHTLPSTSSEAALATDLSFFVFFRPLLSSPLLVYVPLAKMSPSFTPPVGVAAVSMDRVKEPPKMSSGVEADREEEVLPLIVFRLGGRVLWRRGRVWRRMEGEHYQYNYNHPIRKSAVSAQHNSGWPEHCQRNSTNSSFSINTRQSSYGFS